MVAILTYGIFKCIFMNESDRIAIQISFIPMCPVARKLALVQVND